MSEAHLFKTEHEPVPQRHLWRLWGADARELGTAALLGWAALRGLERGPGVGPLLACMAGAWAVLSLVGSLTGRTLWRHALGVRLVHDGGGAPGVGRGLARILT